MGLKLKKPDDAVGSAGPAILIGCFIAFGGVLFGYNSLSQLWSIIDGNANFFAVMTPVPLAVSWP
jgi:hypothetical protein